MGVAPNQLVEQADEIPCATTEWIDPADTLDVEDYSLSRLPDYLSGHPELVAIFV